MAVKGNADYEVIEFDWARPLTEPRGGPPGDRRRPLPTAQDDLTAPTKSRIAKGDQGKVTSLALPSRLILPSGLVLCGGRAAAAWDPSPHRLFWPPEPRVRG